MTQHKEATYDYDSIGPGYYDEVFHRRAGVQSKWHHLKFKHVAQQLPEGFARHLDFGCGPGTFVGTLPDGASSLGVDLAEPQIQYALREYKTDSHDFQRISAGPLPFDDGTFDAVTLIELVEHLDLEAVEALLKEARRVLRPGGKIVLTTPNYGSLWPLLEKVVNARGEVSYEDQHITFFKRKSLGNVLARAGFENVAVTTFQGAAPFVAAISWRLSDWLQSLENPLLSKGMGFLLLGTGTTP